MKEQSFEWMLQGCHSITEIAVAYFPKRTRITVGRIDGGRVHPQNHYTDSETDISLSPAVGHAFTGEGIYRQKSILIRTQNSRKDIMYFNTFFFSFIY